MKSHLFFSYSPRRCQSRFEYVKTRVETQRLLGSAKLRAEMGSVLESEEFKTELSALCTDTAFPVSKDHAFVSQYQRMDGKNEKRHFILNTGDLMTKLKYRFLKIPDTGVPSFKRLAWEDPAGKHTVDAIFSPRYVQVSTTGKYDCWRKKELTSPDSLRGMKQSDIKVPPHLRSVDFQHPSKCLLTPSAIYYISSHSNHLLGLRLEDMEFFLVSDTATGFDYYDSREQGPLLIFFDLVRTRSHDMGHPTEVFLAAVAQTSIRIKRDPIEIVSGERQIYLTRDRKLRTTMNVSRGFISIIKLFKYKSMFCFFDSTRSKNYLLVGAGNIGLLSRTSYRIDSIVEFKSSKKSTAISQVETAFDHNKYVLLVALESSLLHLFYLSHAAARGGIIQQNLSTSTDGSTEIYGIAPIAPRELLVYGWGLMRV